MMVLVGLVIAWRFAGSPTLQGSPLAKKMLQYLVVRLPSSLAITTGSSITGKRNCW